MKPLVLFVALLSLPAAAQAADKKPTTEPAKPAGTEVTLAGTLGCGKCAFKETKQCQNVLKVKEAGKEVTYQVADNAVSQENHEQVCSGPKPATVKGTVSESAGKKVITPSAIKFD